MPWKKIVIGFVALVALMLAIQAVRCKLAADKSKAHLESYHAKSVDLSYGKMAYIDRGTGVPILSAHGLFGGYDQAYDNLQNLDGRYRIIAPSRFGYPGSDILGNGTPHEQAKAYKELLDRLGVEKVFIMGASAGGTVAIRFALDYPERVYGLILYSSAMPFPKKPEEYLEYQGPPAFLMNDYMMFLLSPFFKPIMGLEPETISGMMPLAERKAGAVIDASINNPDMARNFDDYPIEKLQMPSIILHAKDDKVADFQTMEESVRRFPNCTFKVFETGGHLMKGHEEEIEVSVIQFIQSVVDEKD